MAWPCLCLEAWCFPSCAISSTRMLVMDTRNIQPDPCDSRLIRRNNFLQALPPVPRPRRARLVSATSADCSCFAPILMPTVPRLSQILSICCDLLTIIGWCPIPRRGRCEKYHWAGLRANAERGLGGQMMCSWRQRSPLTLRQTSSTRWCRRACRRRWTSRSRRAATLIFRVWPFTHAIRRGRWRSTREARGRPRAVLCRSKCEWVEGGRALLAMHHCRRASASVHLAGPPHSAAAA